MRITLTLGLALALGACTSSTEHRLDASEKLCQTDITSKLLNPETAEFHDFRLIPKEAAEQQILQWAVASDLQRRQAEGLVLPQDPKHTSNVTFFINQQLDSDAKGGAQFAAVRLRADSRLGNKVTSEYVCRVWKDHCLCETEG